MKRRELIRRLERAGCILVREGARHTELKERLAMKILDDLGISRL